jgi:class 3 adenylate cyclase
MATRPDADFDLLRRAYEVAAESHQGQFRASGDPYVSHPVTVATMMVGLGVDDRALCAAILHDTIDYTPLTLTALRREFGVGVASVVAGHVRLNRLRMRRGVSRAEVMAAIGSDGGPAARLRMMDKLHNMRTIEYLSLPKQLRKARKTLDVFAPAAEELRMAAVGAELQTLSFAALIRSQPTRVSSQRTIIALDIEGSTRRTDAVKAELRVMLYELFEAALRSAGIEARDRDEFSDLGDGLLALIHSGGPVSRVMPRFDRLLRSYNTGARPERQLRVRAVVHAGPVNYDGHGCYGRSLDTAFRLLDAPEAKRALRDAPGPLVVVTSETSSSRADRAG